MKRKFKQIPTFTSDEAMEEFLEKTDLSEYDFSAFKPLRIEIQTKPTDARQQESADSEDQEDAYAMMRCVQMPTETKTSRPQ